MKTYIGDDMATGTVDTNSISDLDDLEQVRADGHTDLGLSWVWWGTRWLLSYRENTRS